MLGQHIVNKEIKIKKNLVRKAYSSIDIVNKYSKIGLWQSEEYLIDKYFRKNNAKLKDIKILDIGCGCGRTTIPLKLKGYDVIGIDLSKYMLERAEILSINHNLDIQFLEMDSCNLLFPDNYFDNVLFSYNGIEHVPTFQEKIKLIKEVNRVLKNKGCFIFTVHSGIPNISTFYPWLIRAIDTKKFIRKNKLPNNLEVGERYYNRYISESTYTHIIPIFYWWKWLKDTGFRIIYTNTRDRVRKNKNSSFLSTLLYAYSSFIICIKEAKIK